MNTGHKVWFYTVNNGLHAWFDVAPWGNDDFWASEEIWNFFSQVGNNTTSLNDQKDVFNRRLLKTINVLGQETQSPSNKLLFYIYDDGAVDKKIILE